MNKQHHDIRQKEIGDRPMASVRIVSAVRLLRRGR